MKRGKKGVSFLNFNLMMLIIVVVLILVAAGIIYSFMTAGQDAANLDFLGFGG